MMKRFFQKILSTAALCCAAGASLSLWANPQVTECPRSQTVDIKLPEPMVSNTVVQAEEDATPEQRGLHLFTISGDAAHCPTAEWTDQDELKLFFPAGTDCNTEYKLTFHEDAGYLSGEKPKKRTVSFRCPPNMLMGKPVVTSDGWAVMVIPQDFDTVQARNFSPNTPVRYEFCRVKKRFWSGERYYSRRVAAVVSPARVRDGVGSQQLNRLHALGKSVWGNLKEDSILPGAVLVRPAEELDTDEEWELVYAGAEKSGFGSGAMGTMTPVNELLTGVNVKRPAKDNGEMELVIYFNSPLPEAELLPLFARLGFSVDGDGELTTAPDGRNRKLTVSKDVWLNFRYVGALECTLAKATPAEGEEACLAYCPAGMASGMRVCVSGVLPAVVDVEIPAGLRAANGATVREAHVHRVSMLPAYPELGVSENGVHIMPWSGAHTLVLPVNNMEEVSATLRRVEPGMAPELVFGQKYDTRTLSYLSYQYNMGLLRKRRDLSSAGDIDELWKRLQQEKKTHEEACALRKRWMKTATLLHSQRFVVSSSGMCHPSTLPVDLDALSGGALKPGLYVLTLGMRANHHVRYALSLHKQNAGFLNDEIDIPVLVTDLNLIVADDGAMVTSLADGSLVGNASIATYSSEDSPSAQQVLTKSGVSFSPLASGKSHVIARRGEHMAFGSCSNYDGDLSADEEGDVCYVFVDRPLYRPGDTVHVRGVVRRMHAGRAGMSSCSKVTLQVQKPDYEQMLSRELSLDAFGAFEAEVTLPVGDEDVTGEYDFELKGDDFEVSKSVRCEVFRRDAFAASLKVHVDKVAPKVVSVQVQADDYSGIPLSNARVKLKVKYGERQEQFHTLVTDGSGAASMELPISAQELSEGKVTVSASVNNDREEFVELPDQSHEFSAADFRIVCAGGRIRVLDAVSGKPLSRECKLRIRLEEAGYTKLGKRTSFGMVTPCVRVVDESETVVPADCARGVVLPPAVLKSLRGLYLSDDLALSISGTDAAGRECRLQVQGREAFENLMEAEELSLELAEKAGKLHATVSSPRSGTAQLVVSSRLGMRRIERRLAQGENAFEVDLREGEDGKVALTVLLPPSGRHASAGSCPEVSEFCFVPVPSQHLDVSITPPSEPVRPGQKVSISGRVLAQGNPAEAAVTLYAVDAGMLSVAEYKAPNPEAVFASDSASCFAPRSFHERIAYTTLSCSTMHALWQGDMVQGEARSLSPEGSMSLAFRNSVDGIAYQVADGEIPPWLLDDDTDGILTGGLRSGAKSVSPSVVAYCMADDTPPPVRRHFAPVAVWQAALKTDAEGNFCAEAQLPDTLTTYRVFAVAIDKSGKRFGVAEEDFTVNLPVMITPGMPLFMSVGDSLTLPLSIANNTGADGSWVVTRQGDATPQPVELPAADSATLYFDVQAQEEGELSLHWTAEGAAGTDAVQDSCRVRYPAPLLKEVHHLELLPGQEPVALAALFAPETAQSTRARVQVELSSSPMLHLRGCVDFLMDSTYACSDQRAVALMPWLLYDELAPFCPRLTSKPREEVKAYVQREIAAILARQCQDGGIGFWSKDAAPSPWASAYVAMALTVAAERGYEVPKDKMKRLLRYLEKNEDSLAASPRLMSLRALGHKSALRKELQREREAMLKEAARPHGFRQSVRGAHVEFMLALAGGDDSHAAFRTWLRTVARDRRHRDSCDSAWVMLLLHDYLRKGAGAQGAAVVQVNDARHELQREPLALALPAVARPADLPTTLAAVDSTVYATVRMAAYPEQIEFPGVTEKGLQVTRLYEVQGADGKWYPAPQELRVGDVVRVTLTCAKMADELEYLVVEDYLPACMEAINPNVPSQAVDLEPCEWSMSFDHKEYLPDRVRAFCTRWAHRDLLNMRYYARVKRAGSCTAPPAHAQLMYEPQTYGLSPNAKLISRPAP